MFKSDPLIVPLEEYSALWQQKSRLEQQLDAAEGRAAPAGWSRFDSTWHRDGDEFFIKVHSGFSCGGKENDAEPIRTWYSPYARIFHDNGKVVKDLSAPTILEAIELAEDWIREYSAHKETT